MNSGHHQLPALTMDDLVKTKHVFLNGHRILLFITWGSQEKQLRKGQHSLKRLSQRFYKLVPCYA